MKMSNYRIRDLIQQKNKSDFPSNPNEESSHEVNNIKNDESRLCSVLESLENIIASYLHANPQKSRPPPNAASHADITRDFEPRDRFVTLNLPVMPGQHNSNDEQAKTSRNKEIEAWVGEVCKASISIGFNYFIEKKVEQKQMKAFICENFLRNLVLLVEKCDITAEEMELIDKLLKEKVLPYSKAKYPLTGESQVNKALKNSVKSIDNSQMVQNDYIYSSKVYFGYRADGRYEDLIMELVNEIMKRCDEEILLNDKNKSQGTIPNFKAFENFMSQTFEKSFDESWMVEKEKEKSATLNAKVKLQIAKDKSQKTRTKAEEEEYEQKVKSYTSFLIGRKISQNTESFTADQISSKSISIKSPAILRILTKWCEELWQKFENQSYFLERNDGISAGAKKEVEFLSKKKKKKLMESVKEEKEKIKDFTKEIFEKNYQQQIMILLNEFHNEEDGFIERNQRILAKFAWKSVNNIENFIVDYLNRLIHGLASVSEKLKKQMYEKQPLNLVTFHVSDLFRCKYTSKQKQVLKIFEELQRMSNTNPKKFKIIRIKNRLEQGTHDIMINAKFNDGINCEVQIAVNTSQSEFMRCSNKINHFIYELERAQFGPLMEICSVWRHCQSKADIFAKFIDNEKPRKVSKPATNGLKKERQDVQQWVPEEDPFVCSECSRHYHNNGYFQKHLKKKDASLWKCAPCLIKQNLKAQNKDFFFRKEDKFYNEYRFIKQQKVIPDNGACIFLNKPNKEVIVFKKTYQNFNMKTYLSCLKNNKPSTLLEISSEKQSKALFKKVLFFQLPEQLVNEHLNYKGKIFEDTIDSQQLAPGYLKACFQHQSEVITISEERNLTAERIKQIFDENKIKLKCLSNIHLRDAGLKNLDFMSTGLESVGNQNSDKNQIRDEQSACLLENLEKLEMPDNQIESILHEIKNLKKLKQLDLSRNKISKLPDGFGTLKSLVELSLNSNKFEKLPKQIADLSSLQTLNLSWNQIQTIPPELGQLSSLQTLDLHNNQLQTIPPELGQLSSLQTLELSNNQLNTIPPELGQLSSLQYLILFNNQLQTIPPELGQLSSLQTLYLNDNKLQTIPPELGQLSSLQTLLLHKNQLQTIPPELGQLSSLQYLILFNNQLQTIPPELGQLSSLQYLILFNNKLQTIPPELGQLSSLQYLIFFNNQLQTIPLELGQLSSLRRLKFSNNKLQTIPPELGQLSSLQYLILFNDQLQTIPPELSDLSQLQQLELCSNHLLFIPDEVRNLKSFRI